MVIKIESSIIEKIKAMINFDRRFFTRFLIVTSPLIIISYLPFFFRNPFSNDRIRIRDDQNSTSDVRGIRVLFVRIILNTSIFSINFLNCEINK